MSLLGDYLQGIRLMKRLAGWRVAIRYTLLPLVDYHHDLKVFGFEYTYQIADVHNTPALKFAQRVSMTPVAYFHCLPTYWTSICSL